MYLLNASEIRAAVDEPVGMRIDISHFEPRNLQHTSYYFRLGSRYSRRGPAKGSYYDQPGELSEGNAFLNLEPWESVMVWSYEAFKLDHQILGIFGGVSDIARLGLSLNHSPFIDPLYPNRSVGAPLELGIQNLANEPASLRLHDTIGKVSFFDVSDTYPKPTIEDGSLIGVKMAERREH
jgi:deoxycytidine triphosphate deaminase